MAVLEDMDIMSQTAPDHLQVLQTSTQDREQNKTAAMTEDEQRTSWPGPGLSAFHPFIPRTDSLETVAWHLNLRRNIRHWGSFGFSSFHQGPSIPKYGITIPPTLHPGGGFEFGGDSRTPCSSFDPLDGLTCCCLRVGDGYRLVTLVTCANCGQFIYKPTRSGPHWRGD